MAALISAIVNGGGTPGSNSLSPVLFISILSSSEDWILSGALTFNAQFLCLKTLENELEIAIGLEGLNEGIGMEVRLGLGLELEIPVVGLG